MFETSFLSNQAEPLFVILLARRAISFLIFIEFNQHFVDFVSQAIDKSDPFLFFWGKFFYFLLIVQFIVVKAVFNG